MTEPKATNKEKKKNISIIINITLYYIILSNSQRLQSTAGALSPCSSPVAGQLDPEGSSLSSLESASASPRAAARCRPSALSCAACNWLKEKAMTW